MTDTPEALNEAIERAASLLESLVDDPSHLATLDEALRQRLLIAAGKVSRPSRHQRKAFARAASKKAVTDKRERREAMLNNTGIRKMRADSVFRTPHPTRPKELEALQTAEHFTQTSPEDLNCYVCKADYREVHHFYDQMCPACAKENWEKRFQTSDLTGKVAFLTGGRVKIGYHVGIKLLRAGATLVVTTRFPRDAAKRYAAEPDYAEWGDRLQIHGIDLRHTPSVEALSQYLADTLPRLDYIINNACQTVRRPSGFYTHLMEGEQTPFEALPEPEQRLLAPYEAFRVSPKALASRQEHALVATEVEGNDETLGIREAAKLSQLPLVVEDLERGGNIFPKGQYDQDLQQIDRRERNSWRLPLAEVPTVELLEVQLVNAVAPFLFNGRLKPLMLQTPGDEKHIVNVSAVEGQFYRAFKTDKHPHTNMAKAALNMMTRTSAVDYVEDGIHMNSVDTGWVTDEDPIELAEKKREEHSFHPPLDIVDGAARILDPIFDGLNTGTHQWGKFFKDYKAVNW